MEVKVKLTVEDYQKYNRSYLMSSLNNKWMKILAGYVGLLVIITIALMLFSNNTPGVPISNESEESINYGMIIFPGAIIIFLVSIFASIKRLSKKHYESNKLIQSEVTYKFEKEYFETTADYGTGRITWDMINRVQFFKDSISIFISKSQACVIPKRCLVGNMEKELTDLISEVVPKHMVKK